MFLRVRQNGTFVPFCYSDEGLVQLLEQSMSHCVALRLLSCVEGLQLCNGKHKRSCTLLASFDTNKSE